MARRGRPRRRRARYSGIIATVRHSPPSMGPQLPTLGCNRRPCKITRTAEPGWHLNFSADLAPRLASHILGVCCPSEPRRAELHDRHPAMSAMNPEGYWFKSSKFEIEPREDEDINPRIYGRQSAVWLKRRLEESRGHHQRRLGPKPHVPARAVHAVGRMRQRLGLFQHAAHRRPPSKERVTWHCFATAESLSGSACFEGPIPNRPSRS